jgi:hypothetical protein
LELSNKVFVRILGESTTFISIKENIINIKGSSNKRLIVSNYCSNRGGNIELTRRSTVRVGVAVKRCNSPETFINRADIKIDFNFVILYVTILPHLSVYFL